MARLTANASEKMHARIDRARRTITNVKADARGMLTSAKSGEYQVLLHAHAMAVEAETAAEKAADAMEQVLDRMVRIERQRKEAAR